jgi:hypothetical protein
MTQQNQMMKRTNVQAYERSSGPVQEHTRRTVPRAEQTATGRELVSGPNTKWLAPEPVAGVDFPIHQMMGGGALAGPTVDPLAGVAGGESYETPVSRAKGQLLRLFPFSLVWLALTGGAVSLLGLTFPYLLVGFGLLTAATYWRMNLDEFEFSRNGLERHRVNVAADVRFDEAEKTHELKKIALTTYLEIARAQYLGGNDDTRT